MKAKITALISDVDGVLTDGKLWLNADGQWTRAFHIQDGLGIQRWIAAGRLFAVISGSSSVDIQKRFQALGVEKIFLGASEKLPVMQDLLAAWGVDWQEVAYVGDDLPDLPLLEKVGRAFTVPEAVPEVLAVKGIEITEKSAGEGVIREICDRLLKE